MNKLKLVEKPKELKDSSNFWNCCPLQKDLTPDSECSEGKPSQEEYAQGKCNWWLNSNKDHYCFWKYIKRMSSSDGSMPTASQAELSKLLNIPNTKVPLILKEAVDSLSKILRENDFDVELQDISTQFDNSTIVSREFIDKTSK